MRVEGLHFGSQRTKFLDIIESYRYFICLYLTRVKFKSLNVKMGVLYGNQGANQKDLDEKK